MVLDTVSGGTVNVPDFPSNFSNFENYVIYHDFRSNYYYLLLFNNKIVRFKYSGHIQANLDDGSRLCL